VTTSSAAGNGYRAATAARPFFLFCVASRWRGSGGFSCLCVAAHPGTTETPLSGAVPGFGTVPSGCSAPERARSQAMLERAGGAGTGSRAGDSAWNGAEIPGEQAGPSRLGLASYAHGRPGAAIPSAK